MKRVAVARALATGPGVIFADEPTGSLDSLNREMVMDLLVSAARDQGTKVVLVTHEAKVAAYSPVRSGTGELSLQRSPSGRNASSIRPVEA